MFTIRRPLVATAVTVALAGFAALGVAAPANAATTGARVNICKATGSTSNPYAFVQTTTDQLLAGHYSADDIVPAFTYVTADGRTAMFLGQNTVSTVVTADCTVVVAGPALYM